MELILPAVHCMLFSGASCTSCVCQRQRKRQRLLAEMCAKYFPLGDAEKKLATTTVYKELGVVYCKNDKVNAYRYRRYRRRHRHRQK